MCTQYANEWEWIYSNKTLLTKARGQDHVWPMGHNLPISSLMCSIHYMLRLSYHKYQNQNNKDIFLQWWEKEDPGILALWISWSCFFSQRSCMSKRGNRMLHKTIEFTPLVLRDGGLHRIIFTSSLCCPFSLQIHIWCSTLLNCSLQQLNTIKAKSLIFSRAPKVGWRRHCASECLAKW